MGNKQDESYKWPPLLPGEEVPCCCIGRGNPEDFSYLTELKPWSWGSRETKAPRVCRADTREERTTQRESSEGPLRVLLTVSSDQCLCVEKTEKGSPKRINGTSAWLPQRARKRQLLPVL